MTYAATASNPVASFLEIRVSDPTNGVITMKQVPITLRYRSTQAKGPAVVKPRAGCAAVTLISGVLASLGERGAVALAPARGVATISRMPFLHARSNPSYFSQS